MTAAGEVLSVHRADVETPCRRCGCTIARGQRVALLAAVGPIHVRCILAKPAAERSRYDPEEATLTRRGQEPEAPATAVGDVGEDEIWPEADWPAAPLADDDDRDPRATPWWDR